MKYYAVANGRNIGIFSNWDECKKSVNGFKNAIYKKFDTKEEADNFINNNSKLSKMSIDKTEKINSIKSFFNTKEIKTNIYIPDYYVYTDGACSNNGKDSASAGIGIFFGIDDKRNISKKIEGKQTNNTAELSAIIETYNIIENDIINNKKITIVSDSEYAIRCVSSYGEKCYKKNWNVDIPNKELVKKAYEIYKNKPNIKFQHIKAHTNNNDIHSIGNENADKLANMAIGCENCPYKKPIKIYLKVDFNDKDEVKKLGGRWDKDKKKWFIYDNNKNIDIILDNFLKE